MLEKLASLPNGTLPDDVHPTLGPDATALGQVFWYTLEGRDSAGRPTGGWDLHELRSTQDWYVRYSLASVDGVAEVASVGGFVREYQVDVDPDAMRAYGVSLDDVSGAVRMSNLDVGARTIEISNAEYVIRGLGFVKNARDLELTVVRVNDNVPIYVHNVARVTLGPALRRGALDKGGAEAVGGVVVMRYGENPLATIERVRARIEQISPGLPSRVLDDGTVSRVTIVPFYDRSGLIRETIGTLEAALTEEVLVTIVVIVVMLLHLQSSLLVSGLLPLSVLMCFIAMRQFDVDANIVALSGIAIAIGTMVDMGIVMCESVLRKLEEADPGEDRLEVVFRGVSEVGSAVLTAVLTTVISFLPVFAMEGEEGKLFKPLAFTKTFALLASIIVALTVIPPLAHMLFVKRRRGPLLRSLQGIAVAVVGVWSWGVAGAPLGLALLAFAAFVLLREHISDASRMHVLRLVSFLVAGVVALALASHWAPLGPEKEWQNGVFVLALLGGVLLFFWLFRRSYERCLRLCLTHKAVFLLIPGALVVAGACAWLGFAQMFGFVPRALSAVGFDEHEVTASAPWSAASHALPGMGKEFMPELDEGSYLLMPVTMAHASIGEAMDVLQKQDMAIRAIPEVEDVVGKIGRVESSLDPAPISMIETVITYKPEYRIDESGHRIRYSYDLERDEFVRDELGELIPDEDGRPFRQWRAEIRSNRDIWDAIAAAARVPGTTEASRLGPIKARVVMLRTGMRSNFGLKINGPDLDTIERFGIEVEQLLKQVPSVRPETVVADRIKGKPYLEIEIDREAIARHGIRVRDVQDVIEVAVGGRRITTTVEGRERYPVRVRYQRELRDRVGSLERILVSAPGGLQIPLAELTQLRYRPGPQQIKSEDTFLVGYVLFDMMPGEAEVEVVEDCQRYLDAKIGNGELRVPPGVSFRFAGIYESQVRAEKKLVVLLPLALFAIFLVIYFQFKAVSTTLLVFTGVAVAWAGGFLMLWAYGQPWFLDIDFLGTNARELFGMREYKLSVAVWVGFLALFGIATDDGVIMATYLRQRFAAATPESIQDVRQAVVEAGLRRIRPCLMTSATTILALIPVLTSSGKGADVMVPMAIPTFGGMSVVLITVFVVPTLYCWGEEVKWKRAARQVA